MNKLWKDIESEMLREEKHLMVLESKRTLTLAENNRLTALLSDAAYVEAYERTQKNVR